MARKKTNLIVIHCSATQAKADIGVKEIRQMHLQRGFKDIGYHIVIRRNGVVEDGRGINEIGAHVQGSNATSVGVCLVGGVGPDGKKAENNFTVEQWESLRSTLRNLLKRFPGCRIVGHRDLSPDLNANGIVEPFEWVKQCPSFDVAKYLEANPL